jgi:hypothetical protein
LYQATKVGRRVAAFEILAGDAHLAVGLGADGVDDLVVVAPELVAVEVAPDVYVAEEPHPWVLRRAVEDAHDGLDLLVVRRDAVANEPEGRWQAIEEVDAGLEPGLAEEAAGGVHPRGPGAHDGDPQGLLGSADLDARAHRTRRRIPRGPGRS